MSIEQWHTKFGDSFLFIHGCEELFEELSISVRLANCLKNRGLEKICELRDLSAQDLLRTKGFGKRSVDWLMEYLVDRELEFRKTKNCNPAFSSYVENYLSTLRKLEERDEEVAKLKKQIAGLCETNLKLSEYIHDHVVKV